MPESAPQRYHLVLYQLDGTIATTDLTNHAAYPYDVGDELTLKQGDQWRIVRIDVLDDGVPALVCEQIS